MVKLKLVYCEFSFFVFIDYVIGVFGYIWLGVLVCIMLIIMFIFFLGMVYNFSEYFYSVIEVLLLSFVDIFWYNVDLSKVKVFVSEMLYKDYVVKCWVFIKLDRFGGCVLLMVM